MADSAHFEYLPLSSGQMHVTTAGDPHGEPLLLLHQTPRCWDEFEFLLPYLLDYRVIVPDLPGHGNSAPTENSIESMASVQLQILDQLGLGRIHVAGHHFGGLVAYELASSAPERVKSLVLSSTPYIDHEERARRRNAPAFNWVEPRDDGTHLAELWQRRSQYIAAPCRARRVLSRYVADALRHAEPDCGHEAVSAYVSEDRLGKYRGPVLCLASAQDPRSFPRRHKIVEAFPQAESVVIDEGDISTPETCPEEFSAALRTFHRKVGSDV